MFFTCDEIDRLDLYQVVTECGNVVIEAKGMDVFYEECEDFLVGIYSQWIADDIIDGCGSNLLASARRLAGVLDSKELDDILKYFKELRYKVYVLARKELES